jgi:hypothetical protein
MLARNRQIEVQPPGRRTCQRRRDVRPLPMSWIGDSIQDHVSYDAPYRLSSTYQP